jgi:hypothetical protein
MDDEISQAFSDLTPQQLTRPSSMLNEEPINDRRKNQGGKNWYEWVNSALRSLHMTIASGESAQDASFSILQNPDRRRYFQAEPDETAPMYAERLKREAKLMGATWFFNVLVAPGASHYPNEPEPPDIDPDDLDAIRAALENGRLSVCLCWHAEMLEEDGEHDHSRTGVIPIIGGELSAGTEGHLDDDQNMFAGVLSAE